MTPDVAIRTRWIASNHLDMFKNDCNRYERMLAEGTLDNLQTEFYKFRLHFARQTVSDLEEQIEKLDRLLSKEHNQTPQSA